jgi:hypothetical protein
VCRLLCTGGKSCFKEWTFIGDHGFKPIFEELSKRTDLNFAGGVGEVQMMITGDEETTPRLVRALNHLISQVQVLPGDADDPFAK